jgi:hypothetical protein
MLLRWLRRIGWGTVAGVATGMLLAPVVGAAVSLVLHPGDAIGRGVFSAVLFSLGVAISMTVVWLPILVALLSLQLAFEHRCRFLTAAPGMTAVAVLVAAAVAVAVRNSPTPQPAATSVILTWIVVVVGLFEGEARRRKNSRS